MPAVASIPPLATNAALSLLLCSCPYSHQYIYLLPLPLSLPLPLPFLTYFTRLPAPIVFVAMHPE